MEKKYVSKVFFKCRLCTHAESASFEAFSYYIQCKRLGQKNHKKKLEQKS